MSRSKVSDVLLGAGTGAAAGAPLGPYGALGGAAIGGLAAAFGDNTMEGLNEDLIKQQLAAGKLSMEQAQMAMRQLKEQEKANKRVGGWVNKAFDPFFKGVMEYRTKPRATGLDKLSGLVE